MVNDRIRIPEKTSEFLKANYLYKGSIDWDKVRNHLIQYVREKRSWDLKSSNLITTASQMNSAKEKFLEMSESEYIEKIISDRDNWKNRAEIAESKIKNIREKL